MKSLSGAVATAALTGPAEVAGGEVENPFRPVRKPFSQQLQGL